MKNYKYTEYENQVSALDRKEINDFFKSFLFNMESGQIIDGWLYQIRNSFTGKFLLPNNSFDKDFSEIQKINPGVLLADPVSQWGMGKSTFGKPSPKSVRDTFADFVKDFIDSKNFTKESQNVEGAKMRLIAQLFNTVSNKQQVETFQK